MVELEPRAFSAPGKALLIGGYLVLNPQYKAFVLALSARMHAVVKASSRSDILGVYLNVKSSQFNNNQWNYKVSRDNGYVPLEINDLTNPFVEQVVFNAFNYFAPENLKFHYIEIEIFSDPAYHSSEGSKRKVNQFKSFNFHEKDIDEVNKTGLGSSAGLVTVLTTALCYVLMNGNSLDISNPNHLKMIHNLAQVAHCQAQGKIGSGFDVAAATYGSIIYQRFEPAIIADLPVMDIKDINKYHVALKTLIDDLDWNITCEPVKLPPRLKVIMGDVHSGSKTVKLVSTVQKWYAKNLPRSHEIYEEINFNNTVAVNTLIKLYHISEERPDYYNRMIDDLNNDKNDDPDIKALAESIEKIRELFRTITQESGAAIEPLEQTELLNACLSLRGVIGGVVPGAGGYDAISLVMTEETNIKKITAGNPSFKNVTWMDVTQEQIGLKEENAEYYKDFKSDED